MKITTESNIAADPDGVFELEHLSWNDWWEWENLYTVFYRDTAGGRQELGTTKIAQLGAATARPDLPSQFRDLSSDFFSLGQDESYYSSLMGLANEVGFRFLMAMNDIAAKPELFDRHRDTRVMRSSLLRYVSEATVLGQFARIASGGQKLEAKTVTYLEDVSEEQFEPVSIEFNVSPASIPPSNIHVLIGRNGSGKSRLLRRMAKSLTTTSPLSHRFVSADGAPIHEVIAGVGYVSFSAFDRDRPLRENPNSAFTVFEVGLKKWEPSAESPGRGRVQLKTYKEVARDMGRALHLCTIRSIERWERAVETLESDPIFRGLNVRQLADGVSEDGLSLTGKSIFRSLSSGHQIVLLTVTELVARTQERTIVLLDEPEGHLHPPLLSALIRALSNLFDELNAFAIVATHSPVILQEVPADCVHLVRRTISGLSIGRPRLQTFGENIGALTREVFGLEVEASGFHALLAKLTLESNERGNRDLELLEGKLGSEALALLLAAEPAAGRSWPRLEF